MNGAALQARADLLQEQLERRLGNHVQLKIADSNKWDHWCLRWASRNLPQMTAIMVLFRHIKDDIGCLDDTQCLLACTHTFLDARKTTEKKLEGCYLYFDLNTGQWIRSGKAIGSNFEGRDNEHRKGASNFQK